MTLSSWTARCRRMSEEGRLTFNPSDLDEIYLKLANKLEEYGELAQALFPDF